MAVDLADQIDDYICSFEGVGDLAMDNLAMFIFAWALIALVVVWLCKFLYNKYVVKKTNVVQLNGGVDVKLGATGIETNDKLLRNKSEPKEILSKEILAKSQAKGVVRSAPGGGAVPSTQQIRKRLSRKSPGPELRKPKSNIAPPTNVVGPDTVSVTWTSQVFRWLYTDLVIVNELLHTWVQAINESSKKTVDEHGVSVEIIRILPDSPPPTISNLFCNNNEINPSDLTITWDCDCMPVLQVKALRQKSGKLETSHYKATVSRFRGHMSTKINYLTLKGDMRVEGYPDIRIALNSIGPIKGDTQDENQLQELVTEILVNGLRSTVYPVDFSIYSTCPRAIAMDPDENINNMDHFNSYQNDSLSMQNNISLGKRLLVKVVKGEGLALANDPYCVVEMDEPPQKNQTGARQGMNPYWDEHFLFDLSNHSAEILFEVYDRPMGANDPPHFLGLGLVGIDELAVGPASSQILSLQPRPYETQKVCGAITVEFVFIEGAEIPAGRRPYKLKEALKLSPTGGIQQNVMGGMTNGHNGQHVQQSGRDLADAAIRAIERGALSAGNPSKSTLIIHSVQKVGLNENGQIELDETQIVEAELSASNSSTNAQNGNADDVLIVESDIEPLALAKTATASEASDTMNNSFVESGTGDDINANNDGLDKNPGEPQARSSPHPNYYNGHSATLPRDNHQTMLSNMPTSNNQHLTSTLGSPMSSSEEERGRPTTQKKRDFFGTLKRRLGRSKTRTKSMDRNMIPIDANNPNGVTRSISADRGQLNNSNHNTSGGPRLIVPTLDQSRRSSLSESSAISGISSVSNRTFTHEASTLVLETIENGVKRHFLVPMAIAQRPRWRRKGTKLHIYNDHTFVAKHLSGGLTCDVCNRSIPRRPGKQGYECRDCLTKCHKQCHVRAPQACSNPTVLSIELSKLNSAAADRSIRKL